MEGVAEPNKTFAPWVRVVELALWGEDPILFVKVGNQGKRVATVEVGENKDCWALVYIHHQYQRNKRI